MNRLVSLMCLAGCGAGVLAASFACSGSRPGPGQPASSTVTIAVIPKGTTHVFWRAVHAGAVKAAREAGVEILWQGPIREDDREEQIKVVDNMRARRVAGMVIAPLDDRALRIPVADTVRAGIRSWSSTPTWRARTT